MSSLRHTLLRTLVAATLCSAALPALATWHPEIEGEHFSDYDAPDAPHSFSVFSAGIYDPTVNLVGYVDWQVDTSDTIHFTLGQPGSAGYSLRQFRADFWTTPSLGSGDQGLHLLLRSTVAPGQPLLTVDLMANPSGSGSFADNVLRLNSGELYALTISAVGATNSGAVVSYFLGLSITDPVPEPAPWNLLLSGAALLAFAWRRRAHRQQP
jgi:hypothetical protein